MEHTIVALDPGGTTGWAAAQMEVLPGTYLTDGGELEGQPIINYENIQFTTGQLDTPDHHLTLYNFLGMMHTESYAVVSESFEYRNRARTGLELISREYIGVTRLFCQERKVSLHMQTAATGKGFVKDMNIKKLNLWSQGNKNRHAMDAMRHLLFFMIYNDIYCIASGVHNKLLKQGWSD